MRSKEIILEQREMSKVEATEELLLWFMHRQSLGQGVCLFHFKRACQASCPVCCTNLHSTSKDDAPWRLQHLAFYVVLILADPMVLHGICCGFKLIFLMTTEAEHLFINLSALWPSSFVKHLFKPLPILPLRCLSPSFWFVRLLYILDLSLLSYMCFTNIFSHSGACLFTL